MWDGGWWFSRVRSEWRWQGVSYGFRSGGRSDGSFLVGLLVVPLDGINVISIGWRLWSGVVCSDRCLVGWIGSRAECWPVLLGFHGGVCGVGARVGIERERPCPVGFLGVSLAGNSGLLAGGGVGGRGCGCCRAG